MSHSIDSTMPSSIGTVNAVVDVGNDVIAAARRRGLGRRPPARPG
jgi:hypothetical protein